MTAFRSQKRRGRSILTKGVRGHATPEKKVLDFNSLQSHSLGSRIFRTRYWSGFWIEVWKISSIFKKLSIFQKYDRLSKMVETGLDPRLH